MTSLVLTLLADDGQDALGLSHLFTAHHVQWHETQITRLDGHVTGMALVTVADDEAADRLLAAVRALPGVQVAAVRTGTPTGAVPRTVQMHVLGPDHPSVVPELLTAIADQGLQVRELRTHHHRVEDDEVFGATMLLGVGPGAAGDAAAAAAAAASRLGLAAEADTIYEGID